jgi:PadR family transcriptional regulator PadR
LLPIFNLGKNAYLIAIKDHLSHVTGKKVSLTSAHLPLSRLEKKGYIESKFGEATAVRGGRRKKIYYLTELGWEALHAYKKISDELWENYQKAGAR